MFPFYQLKTLWNSTFFFPEQFEHFKLSTIIDFFSFWILPKKLIFF